MPSDIPIIQWIEDNQQELECGFYGAMSDAAWFAGVGSAFTGQYWATAAAGAVGLAAETAASLAGCSQELNPPDGVTADDPEDPLGDCTEVTGGTADLYYQRIDEPGYDPVHVCEPGSCGEHVRIIGRFKEFRDNGLVKSWGVITELADGSTFTYKGGFPSNSPGSPTWPGKFTFFLVPKDGATCTPNERPGRRAPKTDDEPIGPSTDHTIGDCNWTITPINSRINPQGIWEIYYKVEADNPECGGPYYYWTSAQGPVFVQPKDEPGPTPPPNTSVECPDPCKDYDAELAAIQSTVDQILAKVTNEDGGPDLFTLLSTLLSLSYLLLEILGSDGSGDDKIPGVEYTLQGVCEPVDGGDQPIVERNIPQTRGIYSAIARIDAVMLFLQTHLDFKHKTCGSIRPQLEGTWVSTRWISDGNSPGSERPLRKLFRYRSKSTLTDEQLRDYWSGLTWQAGPFCVSHKGAWWGTPQVWAQSEEEGKRVIRFAGSEAGIDPDQAGQWVISSSDSPRYGMSGTMRLEAPNGIRWVTRREGPSGVPN